MTPEQKLRKKEWSHSYYLANKERHRIKLQEWRKNNPEKYKAQCTSEKAKERAKNWRENNPEKYKAQNRSERYKQKHREYWYKHRGSKPMSENKECSIFLGVHVAERVLAHVFESVNRMPYGTSGYDFICPKGFKIDVKSACVREKKPNVYGWDFGIKQNKIADYFLCLAFDNREDLNPKKIWLIPSNRVNHLGTLSIGASINTLKKWSQYELNDKFENVVACCNTLKAESADACG